VSQKLKEVINDPLSPLCRCLKRKSLRSC
jgi:hypothetical protein